MDEHRCSLRLVHQEGKSQPRKISEPVSVSQHRKTSRRKPGKVRPRLSIAQSSVGRFSFVHRPWTVKVGFGFVFFPSSLK